MIVEETATQSISDSEDDASEDKRTTKNPKLEINAVKEKHNKNTIKVTKGLPIPPFLMTVVAPRKSGKTNLVVDALLDTAKFCNKFDVVYIWSKTFKLDSKWSNVCLPAGSVFEEFIEEEAQILIETVEFVNERLKVPVNVLMIFDDMITEGIMHRQKLGTLEKIAVRGRHIHTSIIIITQQYLALSAPVRNNTTNMLVFRVRNGDEMDKIARENREWLSNEEFTRMFYATTKAPFSFLHINNQMQDPKQRFHKNWNCVPDYGSASDSTKPKSIPWYESESIGDDDEESDAYGTEKTYS